MAIADPSHLPLQTLIRLDGRCAAITGGGRGIGLAMARRFAEVGASVALGDLDEHTVRAAAASLKREFGRPAVAVVLDVRDSASMTAFADSVENSVGPVDIWVNNAAVYPYRTLLEMSDAEWDQVSDINLRGCFLGAREAARRMVASSPKDGRVILNVASVSGFRGRRGLAHYTATKHAVVGLTKSMAVELGPYGIRVLAIAPTLVSTPGIAERRSTLSNEVAALEDGIAAQLPLGRIAVPDDVARAALFCVSDMAALMTGSTIFVDAGATAT